MAQSLIKWNKVYCVGHDEIDKQHKKIFDLINELYAEVSSKKEAACARELVVNLVSYTEEHFELEETLMDKTDYPLLKDHKEAHDQLRKTVEGYRTQLLARQSINVVKLLNFLNHWLKDHILKLDKDFAPYLD